jgi:glycerophosphoryl diester phosphodiesterase
LDEYLEAVKRKPETKLIIEIKNHATPQKETELVKKVLKTVKKYKLEKHVEYIAFRQHVCNELVALGGKDIKVAYLNGDLSPEYRKGMGYTGIDYNFNVLKKRPEWIHEAHKHGLTVNVWTVNNQENLKWCVDNKVDFITTDNPEEAKKIAEGK